MNLPENPTYNNIKDIIYEFIIVFAHRFMATSEQDMKACKIYSDESLGEILSYFQEAIKDLGESLL